ncbi:MAG: hypothetical protein GY862_19765 [Gammaproteobacteria bacterium]|nr:hypothetical protein [Gammaproteobacteria bacterium]
MRNNLKRSDKEHLIDLLLECPIIQNQDDREVLLRQIPPHIANAIKKGASAKVHVINIVDACTNYDDGLEALLEALRFLDGKTKQFQSAAKFLRGIRGAVSSDASLSSVSFHHEKRDTGRSVYKAGGPLFCTVKDKNSSKPKTYIERKADRNALSHLELMQYIMLIAPRQQGKTSLIYRIASLSGYRLLYIDCSTLNAASEHAWYQSVGERLLNQFGKWDKYHIIPSPENSYAWRNFLSELGKQAQQHNQRIVFALDEISAVPSAHSEDFFSVIRESYNVIPVEPEFGYITFILAGTYNPEDLIKNENVSPFNIAHRVHLADFSLEEVRKLVRKGGWSDEQVERLGERIYHWTEGQPYLTQLLCSYLGLNASPGDVDIGIEDLLSDENHIRPLHKRLKGDQESYEYAGKILLDEKIKFYPGQNPQQAKLELMGIIKADASGYCTIRNRIYKRSLKLFGCSHFFTTKALYST